MQEIESHARIAADTNFSANQWWIEELSAINSLINWQI